MTPANRTHRGFTLIELLVVISIIVLLIAILLPVLGAVRRAARQTQNATHLQGIHQGMVTFSRSNRGYFPGLDSAGDVMASGAGATGSASQSGYFVQSRFWILLDSGLITPEYAISPSEVKTMTPWVEGNAVQFSNNGVKNYSYALLQIGASNAGRLAEWKETLNGQAIVAGDRNIGSNAGNTQSIHNDEPGNWTGSVLWNDNQVSFEDRQLYDTKYGGGALNTDDDIFADESNLGGNGNAASFDAVLAKYGRNASGNTFGAEN